MLNNLSEYISKNRTAIMGIAIIWVFLLHSAVGNEFTGVTSYTLNHEWIGVDIFIFLSSFGLCYSLKKNSLKKFYHNRVLRIIPSWLIVLILVHIAGTILSPRFPDFNFEYPQNLLDYLFWYTGLGYYFNGCQYEWYVPTILLFYAITPLVAKLDTKKIWLLLLISTVLVSILTYFKIAYHLHYSYQRVMCFLLGILFYRHTTSEKLSDFYRLTAIGAIIMLSCTIAGLLPDVFFYEFLTPCVVLLFAQISRVSILNAVLSFMGSISLEFYLVHLFRRPQFLVGFFTDNIFLKQIGAFAISLLAAIVLQKIANALIKKISL